MEGCNWMVEVGERRMVFECWRLEGGIWSVRVMGGTSMVQVLGWSVEYECWKLEGCGWNMESDV